MGFFGKKAKSENRPRCRAKSESDLGGRIPTLARARQGFYAGQVARPGTPMPGRNVMLESTSGSALDWKQNHFLVCGVPLNPGVTTELKKAIRIFFLGIPWRGLGRAPMPGRHQAAEPSQFPGPLLYVLYVLYLTRQATESTLPRFLAICAMV